MKKPRHTPEQIVRNLREADRLLGEGLELPEAVETMEVSEAMYHRWRARTASYKAQVQGLIPAALLRRLTACVMRAPVRHPHHCCSGRRLSSHRRAAGRPVRLAL